MANVNSLVSCPSQLPLQAVHDQVEAELEVLPPARGHHMAEDLHHVRELVGRDLRQDRG
jgi:hypothetical protein